MVFRLPTHLETFVPPPSEQVPQSRPWQGTLILHGLQAADNGAAQELRVTAVETDGDNRVDLWPTRFFVQLTHGRSPLRDMQAWVRRHRPPLCTFMPDRFRDPNINANNQANFRSLSRILFENQMVAIAPWNSERLPGAGIIIYPAQNASAILVGAIFLSSPFPDFLAVAPPNSFASSSLVPPAQSRYPGYQQPMSSSSSYGSMSRHAGPHPSASYPQQNYQGSAVPPYTSASTSSTDPVWPLVKDEDDGDLSEFTTTLRSGHGHTQYPQ